MSMSRIQSPLVGPMFAAVGLLATAGSVAADYIPPVFTGTGPYRRVYSHSAYSYTAAYITLPSAPSISVNGSDTPYVYTGGWGTNGLGAADGCRFPRSRVRIL